jgi:nucleoside-diphosphate kinase
MNMQKHIEQTLVLLKPDAVERALIGEIISRFEKAGFKIVAMKLVKATPELVGKHYDEDLAKRRGEHIRQYNINYIASGPVLAMVIEGVAAVENVRKFCGTTEPKSSPPGTIRGDYSHVNYGYCDDEKMVVKNIIHASENQEYAKKEIGIWFKPAEIVEYHNVHEKHTR